MGRVEGKVAFITSAKSSQTGTSGEPSNEYRLADRTTDRKPEPRRRASASPTARSWLSRSVWTTSGPNERAFTIGDRSEARSSTVG